MSLLKVAVLGAVVGVVCFISLFCGMKDVNINANTQTIAAINAIDK
jgi:hypothetical protein